MMQSMIANRLLKKWLSKITLEKGELRPALMLYEEDGESYLVTITLRVNEDKKLEVARVVDNVNLDEAL
jgi:hypothetical protein